MDKLSCMRSFCEVMKAGSFSQAARQLGISKVMVSRNVSALESELGLRLLQRTTRKMSPTDEGRAYYERCQALLDEFDELDASIKDRAGQARGRLRLSVPSESFFNRQLLPFFSDFARQHSELELDIALSDRYIDIVEEGFDAAIRIGQLQNSSLIARRLADMQQLLCASPDYCAAQPPINQPEDLQQHELIIDSNYRGGQHYVFKRGQHSVSVKASGRLRINSADAVSSFLLQGIGIAVCPSFMVSDELKSGQLQQLLPEWSLGSGGIYLLYSHRKHLSAKVRLLQSALCAYFDKQHK
ncbi:LysR family transcriptional regulator [Agaribacterium haliotis]|uniref:LysR family transcriptional regulator n=1 Tax=Agaribacterium haliotis TaxID=2013869 RepID=UPI000BB59BBE|nr:LysR family transcriptional regulator [Agaribacterium haliotis]